MLVAFVRLVPTALVCPTKRECSTPHQMQQSIVPPTFFFPLFLCPCTRLYDTAGHAPLAGSGSGRGLLATGSFTFKPPASANFMATPSAGSGTAQILAVNKELANAAPTQRRTTAKWKVPALPPRVFFVCFLAFILAFFGCSRD